MMVRLSLRVLVLLALLPVALAACKVQTDRWIERQAAVDPPELWRVEVVGSDARPVQLCADSILRKGFVSPLPEAEGQPCIPIGDPVETAGGRIQRCAIGNQTLLVAVRVEGDPAAFSVTFSAQTLRQRTPFAASQTRRYTRLGPCPEGWKVGDNTDQNGERRNNIWPPAWG